MTTLQTAAEQITAVAQTILDQGGVTASINGSGEVPTEGIAVAVPGYERIVPLDETLARSVAQYVYDYLEVLSRPNHYLGGWIEDGVVYLDVSEVFADREAGIQAGRDRAELAVYDIAADEAIRTFPVMAE